MDLPYPQPHGSYTNEFFETAGHLPNGIAQYGYHDAAQEAHVQYPDQNLGNDQNQDLNYNTNTASPGVYPDVVQDNPYHGDPMRYNSYQTQYPDGVSGIPGPIDDPQNSFGPLRPDNLAELLADTSHEQQNSQRHGAPAQFGNSEHPRAAASFNSSTTNADNSSIWPAEMQVPPLWQEWLRFWMDQKKRAPSTADIHHFAELIETAKPLLTQWFCAQCNLTCLPVTEHVESTPVPPNHVVAFIDSETLERIAVYIAQSLGKTCKSGTSLQKILRCIHNPNCKKSWSYARVSDWKRHLMIYWPQNFWECPFPDCINRIHGRAGWLASHLQTNHGYNKPNSHAKAAECRVDCDPPYFRATCDFCHAEFETFETFTHDVSRHLLDGEDFSQWTFQPPVICLRAADDQDDCAPIVPTRPRPRRGHSHALRRGSSARARGSIADSASATSETYQYSYSHASSVYNGHLNPGPNPKFDYNYLTPPGIHQHSGAHSVGSSSAPHYLPAYATSRPANTRARRGSSTSYTWPPNQFPLHPQNSEQGASIARYVREPQRHERIPLGLPGEVEMLEEEAEEQEDDGA